MPTRGDASEDMCSLSHPVPSLVAGHAVRCADQTSLGCESRLAYAALPNVLAVVDCKGGAQDPITSASYYALPNAEASISVVVAHPTEDYLCVGTGHHGLYVTTLSSPIFSDATRLPLEISGERIYQLTLLHAPPPSPKGGSDEDTAVHPDILLAISSSLKDRKDASPHRLSLWSVQHKCLRCRVPMEPLECLCSITDVDGTFAACTGSKVYLHTVQHPPSPNGDALKPRNANVIPSGSHSKGKLVMYNRLCGSVKELEGAEYVHCAYHPCTADKTFLALTTNGYLVAFDRTTGLVVRWMDCKVCPSMSVGFSPDGYVVLAGSIVRFFKADSWEFGGKIKAEVSSTVANSSFLGTLLSSTYVATVSIRGAIVLFSRSGELSVCAVETSSVRSKLVIRSQFHFLPIPSGPPVVCGHRSGYWVMWSSKGFRIYTPRVHLKRFMELATTCAAFHRPSNTLVAYDETAGELIALGAASGWEVSARVGVPAALSSLVVSTASGLCAGLCAQTKTVVAYQCCIPEEDGPVQLTPVWSRAIDCADDITRLLMVENRVFGVSERSLVSVEEGALYPLPDGFVDISAAGADVIVVNEDGCTLHELKQGTSRRLCVPVKEALQHVYYDYITGLAAIAGTTQAAVVSVKDEQGPSFSIPAIVGATIIGLSLRPDAVGVRLSIWDAAGQLYEYILSREDGTTLTPATAAGRSRLHSAPHIPSRRVASAGGPTNRELKDRFDALAGFYQQHRASSRDGPSRAPRGGEQRKPPPAPEPSGAALKQPSAVPLQRRPQPPEDVHPRPWPSTAPPCPAELVEEPPRPEAVPPPMASMDIDVSALTIPTEWGSAGGRLGDEVPPLCDRSPLRDGDLDPSTCRPPSEDAVIVASAHTRSTLAGSPRDLPAASEAHSMTESVNPTRATSISSQTRQLRGSLLQLRDWLASATVPVEEEEAELRELPALLTDVATALHSRVQGVSTRHASSVYAASENDSESSHSLQSLLVELQRIREQNERLESQNKAIMARLERSTTR